MRLPQLFGISALYRRLIIENKPAFSGSMEALLELDCDRLIVAHWKPIETEAKRVVEEGVTEVPKSLGFRNCCTLSFRCMVRAEIG